jgi:hypothetical protein
MEGGTSFVCVFGGLGFETSGTTCDVGGCVTVTVCVTVWTAGFSPERNSDKTPINIGTAIPVQTRSFWALVHGFFGFGSSTMYSIAMHALNYEWALQIVALLSLDTNSQGVWSVLDRYANHSPVDILDNQHGGFDTKRGKANIDAVC